MGSVPDLREIAAYSAMAELISEYFTKAKDGMGWGPTPGGMYQIASVQKYMGTAGRVGRWTGWELAGLSLMPPNAWAVAVNRTQARLEPARWHCYHRLYGGQ